MPLHDRSDSSLLDTTNLTDAHDRWIGQYNLYLYNYLLDHLPWSGRSSANSDVDRTEAYIGVA